MARNTRSRLERLQTRVKITELYLQGKTQAEIAALLSMTQQQVSYDLQVAQKVWMDNSVQHITDLKAEELAKIDMLEKTYWEAFASSKQTKKKTKSQRAAAAKSGETMTAEVSSEDMQGDPRYLSGVMSCIERRIQLLGIDAPKRIQVDDGRWIDKIRWDSLSKDQLQRLTDGEDPEKVIPGFRIN